MQRRRIPLNLHRKAKDFIIGVKRLCIVWMQSLQFVEKALLFHKPKPYLKWKRGLSPLFQAFFPLQPKFSLNQAAVFEQSQRLCIVWMQSLLI